MIQVTVVEASSFTDGEQKNSVPYDCFYSYDLYSLNVEFRSNFIIKT